MLRAMSYNVKINLYSLLNILILRLLIINKHTDYTERYFKLIFTPLITSSMYSRSTNLESFLHMYIEKLALRKTLYAE